MLWSCCPDENIILLTILKFFFFFRGTRKTFLKNPPTWGKQLSQIFTIPISRLHQRWVWLAKGFTWLNWLIISQHYNLLKSIIWRASGCWGHPKVNDHFYRYFEQEKRTCNGVNKAEAHWHWTKYGCQPWLKTTKVELNKIVPSRILNAWSLINLEKLIEKEVLLYSALLNSNLKYREK